MDLCTATECFWHAVIRLEFEQLSQSIRLLVMPLSADRLPMQVYLVHDWSASGSACLLSAVHFAMAGSHACAGLLRSSHNGLPDTG